MKIWVIVPAAGIGNRFDAVRPKQFHVHRQRFLFVYGLQTLLANQHIAGVILATGVIPRTPADAWQDWQDVLQQHAGRLKVTSGAAERSLSVFAGLQCLLNFRPWNVQHNDGVLVHDGVRPCLNTQDLMQVVEQLQQSQDPELGFMLGQVSTDSLKRVDDNGYILESLNRQMVWQAQTPQGFPVSLLHKALKSSNTISLPTDESQAVRSIGGKVQCLQAQHQNPKLTYQSDLSVITYLLDQIRHHSSSESLEEGTHV